MYTKHRPGDISHAVSPE